MAWFVNGLLFGLGFTLAFLFQAMAVVAAIFIAAWMSEKKQN